MGFIGLPMAALGIAAWLAPITFGEAWHNNHHAFPTSARHGLGPWQPTRARG